MDANFYILLDTISSNDHNNDIRHLFDYLRHNKDGHFKQYSAFNIGCFTIMIFLVSCDCYCSVAHPCGAMGWSTVRDCGISGFLTYLENYILLQMLPR